MSHPVLLVSGPEIARYGFPQGHPFGTDRHGAFMARLEQSPVAKSLIRKSARAATRAELEYFHTPAYVDRVIELSKRGSGFLDAGDTRSEEHTSELQSQSNLVCRLLLEKKK